MNHQIQPFEQHTNDAELMPLDTTDNGLALLVKQAKAMDAAHRLATALCNTKMVPETFRGKPDDGAAAILYGAELGLKPQQALQQVFVVHGQPAIYARTMAGLLKAKGYTFETVEDTPESVTVTGTSPRGETQNSTWTIARATKAGYTSNKKYQTDPQAMLYAKALSDVCRKLAPDVLLGITYAAEDLQLEPVQMTAARQDGGGRGRAGLQQALAADPAPTADAPGGDTTPAPPSLEDLRQQVETAPDRDTLGELMLGLKDKGLSDEDYQSLAQAANKRWDDLATEAGE